MKKFISILSCALSALILSSATVQAQTPVFKFCKPTLKSGTDKAEGAVYFFDKVYTTVTGFEVDAYITLKTLVNGATLTNIDDSINGYYNAWQPTVTGNSAIGSSKIDWEIEFITNTGAAYRFTDFEFAAIDVDGDGMYTREFVEFQDASLHFTPAGVVSALTIIDNLSNSGSGNNNGVSQTVGPISNRTGIDTSSLDVKVNYLFTNKSKFTMSTGVQVETVGGAISRFFCIYPIDAEILRVLPVRISFFDANAEGLKAILKWNTETKTNNDHFEIERSFDNNHFKSVALITDGFLNADGSKSYSFKDASAELANHTVVYYRVKQNDGNQNITYSETRFVRFAGTETTISVMPNPYVETLNVSFISPDKATAQINIIGMNGTLVARKTMSASKGTNVMSMNQLGILQPGGYTVVVLLNGKMIGTQQVIK